MKKILVIDDEVDFCSAIEEHLKSAGEYEVSVCSESTDAVRLVREVQPDLILLDIRMQGVSGDQIAERLKSREETRSIPIVFLTAVVTDEETRERRNVIGGHYFVAKPVRIDELQEVVRSVLSEQEES